MAQFDGIWHISVVYGTIGIVPWHLVQFRWHFAQFRWHFAQLSGYLVQYCTKCHFGNFAPLQKHLAQYSNSRATMQRANITSFKKFLDQNLSIKIKSLADVTFDCLERHQPPVKYISYIIKFLRRCKNLKQGGFVPLPP